MFFWQKPKPKSKDEIHFETLKLILDKLRTLEIEMSKITDAVAANKTATDALTTATSNLATSVAAVDTTVKALNDQVANDDTVGNNAAAETLAASTTVLTTAAAAIQKAADDIATLAKPVTPPAA